MAIVEKDKISSTIETVVRESIRSGNIIDVVVRNGRDADGDDIIIVNVIFDNKAKSLDATETSRITRFVRNRLIQMNEDRFPFFSYIAKSEAGKLAAA
jgi:hypothetical protein